jgi:predicted PP-loop superfamily ATPase
MNLKESRAKLCYLKQSFHYKITLYFFFLSGCCLKYPQYEFKAMSKAINKVVLAYSGGLDTSIIVKWLQETYQCEVVTYTADVGQGEEVEPARAKAEAMGIKEIYIDDLRKNLCAIMFFLCFVQTLFMKASTYSVHPLLDPS